MMASKSYSLRTFLVLAALVMLGLTFGPLGCNKSSADATEADQAKSETKSDEAKKTEDAKDEKPADDAQAAGPTNDAAFPADMYPGFNFAALEPDERAKFVEVAKAELCPCPNAVVSLHECLQDRKARCMLAEQSATIVAVSIKEGLNQTDVLARLAENIEAAKKKHDFDLAKTPFKGNKDAKVVIVEFADFECPFCREASRMMKKASEKYGDKVAIYFKHFPLSGHPNARVAAHAAAAAHMQGKFWPMHDLLFENQRALSPEKINQLAQQVGLNFGKFQKDMQAAAAVEQVSNDRREGEEAKITGTPSIFINGVRYMGDLNDEAISTAIDQALKATTTDQKK